jgi:hypothetical protein
MLALKPKHVAWIGALLLSGVVWADPPVAKPASADDALPDFDNLEIVDAALNAKLGVLRVGSATGENNVLTVFAGLRNKSSHKLVLEVETIYKDKAGNELNTGSWIRVTLKPHEESDYRSASISEAAVDFLIRVRRPPTATVSSNE